ncbi:MAG TPA: hypothetical protein O0X73_01885 [Methanocorpusculum sp.]|nr:hypothetical protein [Methanocorpusculum sp.]
MKKHRDMAIVLVMAFILLPVFTGAAIAADPTSMDEQRCVMLQRPELSNHYGYITINSVDVILEGANAVYTINYSIVPWIAFLVFLLGKQDLKNRLLKIINPSKTNNGQVQEIVFQYVDNEKAIILVSNASISYGDDTYWYPKQEFAVQIPRITYTASFTKVYNNTRGIERGFGYY